jgi:hypothetical protein
MSGELTAARATVAAALRAGGVATPEPGDPYDTPCALIRPGSPWVEHVRVGGKGTRLVRLNVLLVAGVADTLASLVAMEGLAQATVLALSPLSRAGWTQGDVTAVRAGEVLGLGGIQLLAEVELGSIVTLTA